MKDNKASKPPRLPLRFFRWFCHPKLGDGIEGDLMELYEERVKEIGKRKADLKFIGDVLLLFRPSIISPTEGYQTLNTYGMYKSYFKIGWRNWERMTSNCIDPFKRFVAVVAISFIIAIPLSIYLMEKWLQGFAYRIEVNVWLFILAGISTVLIAQFTMSFKTIKAFIQPGG